MPSARIRPARRRLLVGCCEGVSCMDCPPGGRITSDRRDKELLCSRAAMRFGPAWSLQVAMSNVRYFDLHPFGGGDSEGVEAVFEDAGREGAQTETGFAGGGVGCGEDG